MCLEFSTIYVRWCVKFAYYINSICMNLKWGCIYKSTGFIRVLQATFLKPTSLHLLVENSKKLERTFALTCFKKKKKNSYWKPASRKECILWCVVVLLLLLHQFHFPHRAVMENLLDVLSRKMHCFLGSVAKCMKQQTCLVRARPTLPTVRHASPWKFQTCMRRFSFGRKH